MTSAARPAGAFYAPSRSHVLAGRTILQIIPELEAGGAERTAVDIAAGLVAAGARALVATEGGRLVGELQAKGGVWAAFPARTKNPFRMLVNVRRLARLCVEENVALIHARSRAPAWVALGAARSLGLPFVTTFHGSYAGRSAVKLLYNSVMARGDVVIANSHYTSDLIRSLYPGAAERIRIIHRGTELSIFSPAAVSPERVQALRRGWGVAPHERVVLLAARLTGWKGQKVLIEAAAQLKQAGIGDLAFVLAGDHQGRDAYVRDLDATIASLGPGGRRAAGRPLHGHARGLPRRLGGHGAVDRAGSVRPFGRGGAGHGNAGGRPRSSARCRKRFWRRRRSPRGSGPAGGCRQATRRPLPKPSAAPWRSAPAPAKVSPPGRALMWSAISRSSAWYRTRSMSMWTSSARACDGLAS